MNRLILHKKGKILRENKQLKLRNAEQENKKLQTKFLNGSLNYSKNVCCKENWNWWPLWRWFRYLNNAIRFVGTPHSYNTCTNLEGLSPLPGRYNFHFMFTVCQISTPIGQTLFSEGSIKSDSMEKGSPWCVGEIRKITTKIKKIRT